MMVVFNDAIQADHHNSLTFEHPPEGGGSGRGEKLVFCPMTERVQHTAPCGSSHWMTKEKFGAVTNRHYQDGWTHVDHSR